jgi:hypothetical protein
VVEAQACWPFGFVLVFIFYRVLMVVGVFIAYFVDGCFFFVVVPCSIQSIQSIQVALIK